MGSAAHVCSQSMLKIDCCTLRANNLQGKQIFTPKSLPQKEPQKCATPCGYCADALFLKSQHLQEFSLDEKQQNRALQIHFCRCASWNTIRNAVFSASEEIYMTQEDRVAGIQYAFCCSYFCSSRHI